MLAAQAKKLKLKSIIINVENSYQAYSMCGICRKNKIWVFV